LLARDYPAILASSVSSKHTFSLGGITISKCQNQLKHDIVRALQVLKSVLKKEVIFCMPQYTSVWEIENEVEDDNGDLDWVDDDDGIQEDEAVISLV
jgi:hypothetical protein